MLTRIESRVLEIDPHMSAPVGRKSNSGQQYNHLVEAKEFRDFKGGIAVRITACEVNAQGRATLISIYDRAAGDQQALPPPEKRLRLGRGPMCREEIHYWSKVEGTWIKQAVNTIFLQ